MQPMWKPPIAPSTPEITIGFVACAAGIGRWKLSRAQGAGACVQSRTYASTPLAARRTEFRTPSPFQSCRVKSVCSSGTMPPSWSPRQLWSVTHSASYPRVAYSATTWPLVSAPSLWVVCMWKLLRNQVPGRAYGSSIVKHAKAGGAVTGGAPQPARPMATTAAATPTASAAPRRATGNRPHADNEFRPGPRPRIRPTPGVVPGKLEAHAAGVARVPVTQSGCIVANPSPRCKGTVVPRRMCP